MPGRKFVAGRNWGGKAVNEKTLSFYYLFIQHIKKLHNEVGLDGNVYSTPGQTALIAVTDVIKVCLVDKLLFNRRFNFIPEINLKKTSGTIFR